MKPPKGPIEIPGIGISWFPSISLVNLNPNISTSIINFTGFWQDSNAHLDVSDFPSNWLLHSMLVPEIEHNQFVPGNQNDKISVFSTMLLDNPIGLVALWDKPCT